MHIYVQIFVLIANYRNLAGCCFYLLKLSQFRKLRVVESAHKSVILKKKKKSDFWLDVLF